MSQQAFIDNDGTSAYNVSDMKKKIKLSMILILLAIIFGWQGCQKEIEVPLLGNDYNLLVITIDTMRADRIGIYGCENAITPNIDYLGENGVLFENCYTSVPLTLPAHCTLFTGRETLAHNVRNNGSYLLPPEELTLAEIMKNHNFKTYALIASFILHSKFGLNQGFDFYDDSLKTDELYTNLKSEISADTVYEKFTGWLAENHQENFFCWLHFFDPHAPYSPPAEYQDKFPDEPYNGEVSYVDEHIGKIIQDLKTRNILDKTLIIIAGDHGEAFGEHDEYEHGIFCYQVGLKVPLIFYNPKILKKSQVVSRRVRLMDIMPTILKLFFREIPEKTQGEDLSELLFKKNSEEKDPVVYFESLYGKEEMNWAPLTGIIFQNHKYISLPQPELYDLENDPEENHNIFWEKNQLAKKIDGILKKYILDKSQSGSSSKRKMTADDKKQLESLGYISAFSSTSDKPLDPKEGITSYNRFRELKRLIKDGNYQQAEQDLHKLITDNPELSSPVYYDLLLSIYEGNNDSANIEKTLKKSINDFPRVDRFKLYLANYYFRQKNYHQAEKVGLKLITQNPQFTPGYIQMAEIVEAKGELKQAVSYLNQAQELEPLNAKLQIKKAAALTAKGEKDTVLKIITNLLENYSLDNSKPGLEIKASAGMILARISEFEKALLILEEVTAEGYVNADIQAHLGMTYFKTGKLPQALEAYEQSLKLDKNNPLTYSQLGTLYLTLFRIQKKDEYHRLAIQHYEKALNLNTNLIPALNGLGACYSFVNQWKKAIGYWERVYRSNANFYRVYFNLGIGYLKVRNKKKALKYLKECRSRFFTVLNPGEQQQLNILIAEAEH